MKLIDIKNSYPGFEDSYIQYRGSIDNTSGANYTGTTTVYTINTDIRSGLVVKAKARQYTKAGLLSCNDIELGYTTSTSSSGTLNVILSIPISYKVDYTIEGYTSPTAPTDREISSTTSASTMDWTKGHNHNGRNSSRIHTSGVYNESANAGKVLAIDSEGNIVPISIAGVGSLSAFALLNFQGVIVTTTEETAKHTTVAELIAIDFSNGTDTGWESASETATYEIIVEVKLGGGGGIGDSSGLWNELIRISTSTDEHKNNANLSGLGLEVGNLLRWRVLAVEPLTSNWRESSNMAYFEITLPE